MNAHLKIILHGLLVSVGTPVLALVTPILQAGKGVTHADLVAAGWIALGAAITYIGKVYLFGSSTAQLEVTPEQPKP
jgi:hypothetical protein